MVCGFALPGVVLRATPGYDLAPLQGDQVSADAIFDQPWARRAAR